MKVGEHIRKALLDWDLQEDDSAMLHACIAVDATARRLLRSKKVGDRFKKLMRDNYAVLGPMGAPGLNLSDTRFPKKGVTDPSKWPDLADVIYDVHRNTQAHGDELPPAYELIPDVRAGEPSKRNHTRIIVGNDRVHMSDRIIFGLLAVAVLAPVNRDQQIPDGPYLMYEDIRMPINEWWGRKADFIALLAASQPLPSVKMDFVEPFAPGVATETPLSELPVTVTSDDQAVGTVRIASYVLRE